MLFTRRKKAGITLVGFILLVVSLVACTNQSASQTAPQTIRETVVVTQEVPVRETVVVRETVEVPVEEPIVYVYSARHYGQMETAFAEFTKETGIEVRFTFGSDAELRERLKAEGRFTPADVLFTVDAANLWLAAQEGLLRPINSDVLESNIPDYLQDPSNQWYALSLRCAPSRTIQIGSILKRSPPTSRWPIQSGQAASAGARQPSRTPSRW